MSKTTRKIARCARPLGVLVAGACLIGLSGCASVPGGRPSNGGGYKGDAVWNISAAPAATRDPARRRAEG